MELAIVYLTYVLIICIIFAGDIYAVRYGRLKRKDTQFQNNHLLRCCCGVFFTQLEAVPCISELSWQNRSGCTRSGHFALIMRRQERKQWVMRCERSDEQQPGKAVQRAREAGHFPVDSEQHSRGWIWAAIRTGWTANRRGLTVSRVTTMSTRCWWTTCSKGCKQSTEGL